MKLIRFTTPLLAVFFCAGVCLGQGRQGGQGGSTFGSSGTGSTFGGGGVGNSGFGSGTSGSGFGSGGFGGGQGGFGGGGFGGQGGFGGGGFGGQGGFGTQGGQLGNFGDNQSFVGSNSDDVRQIMQQMGRNSDQFTQTMDRAMSRRRGRRDNDSGDNQAPPIRVQLKVAFDYPTASASAVPTAVSQRLERILTAEQLPMPDVEFRDGVVTLRGTAPTQSDRLLMEKLVSLEPGVSRVVNQMTVPEELVAPTPQE